MEHGIAQKFHLLVVIVGLGALSREGAVGQSMFQQCAVSEAMAQGIFQRIERQVLHRNSSPICQAAAWGPRGGSDELTPPWRESGNSLSFLRADLQRVLRRGLRKVLRRVLWRARLPPPRPGPS